MRPPRPPPRVGASFVLVAWLVALLTGCSRPGAATTDPAAPTASPNDSRGASAPPGTRNATPAPLVDQALPDRDWQAITSRRQGLRFALPARREWRVNDVAGPWLEAQHAPSHSQLIARRWRAPARVTPEDCERQARLWRPSLPSLTSEQLVDERYLSTPEGFRTYVLIGIAAIDESSAAPRSAGTTTSPLPSRSLRGYALAFGASAGHCIALAYATRDDHAARPAHAQRVIGERLSLVRDGILTSLQLLDIDRRIRREPPTTASER